MKKTTYTKTDVFQEVTDRIIAKLEEGKIPWEKPWQSTAGARPSNFKSGKAYKGINVLLLAMTGRTSPFWLTFKQAQEMGGMVRKGETGTKIVFWKISKYEKEDKTTGEKEEKTAAFCKFYSVFNADQIDGIDFPKPADVVPNLDNEPLTAAELIVNGFADRPTINKGFEAACYVPSSDRVEMPHMDRFKTSEEYYCVLFHELTHSTGHQSRCNRDLRNSFGSDQYAREELVAELGATYLCAESGLDRPIDNSVAYIQSWIKRFRNDKKLICTAAGKAEKAVDHILGTEAKIDTVTS